MTRPAVTRLAKPTALLRGELLELRAALAERHRAPIRVEVVAVQVEQPSSSWRRWAACKGRPVSWWFPARGDTMLARAAVKVCEGCGVREQCLAEAMAEESGASATDVTGIRGGLLPAQRLKLARPQAATVARNAPAMASRASSASVVCSSA